MKTRYIVYIALALVVGFLIFNKLHNGKSKEASGQAAGAKGGKKKNGPVPVKVMIVKDTAVTNNIDLTGTIDPNEKVNLVSQTAGNITGIYFQEGSRVSKGQVLVKVYNADLVASLKQNQYQITLAQQNEYRNKVLLSKEAVSQQEYDTSLSNYNSLKAQGDVIKAQIARTEIRAPFSGVIGLRNVSPGGYLSPSTSIATLVSTDPMKVTFSVPERYQPLIKPGSKVSFNIASSRENFTAVVYAIEPAIDQTSRTVTVRARAANPKNLITAGGFAKINLTLDQIPKTIMVPTECVIPDLKNSKVYIAHNGTAVVRPVKTDLRTDTKIEITDGLKAGDSLIISGLIQMRPKVPLKIVKVIK
ncbi:efflux RND transporter periplasmic adaptor subunit [Mucilaginibacter agri]|uniref:Efflux RND transporter periplasmic adaptor subunit n=1 Tax=Mucilaginibacter agri TaxID=2695265 RepID=A0A966DTH5_9SPHI|nr:efflux RND transporter periplasmic adaptor subunit [Mucilaginibacter agri]NCD68694.1 efflux RND transporter periplasmic adaptor subunit [Mucilaginibacter agri]